MEIDDLIQNVLSYTSSSEVQSALSEAFEIASGIHMGFERLNRDSYISHPLAVARILAEWHAPLPVVAAGLLHDIRSPDYSHPYDIEQIQSVLGLDIYKLLEATINLNGFIRQIERNFETEVDVVNIQHYMTSVLEQEPNAVVIKIADRLHNLQTIDALSRYYQERAARIGFNLLAPLADRLGMGNIKRSLEDFSFEIINPVQYQVMKQRMADADLHQDIQQVLVELSQAFVQSPLHYEVCWQPTSLYWLYRHQIEQNVRHGKSIHSEPPPLRIVDAGAFVIQTEEEEDCYRMLGSIHKRYQPVKGQFRDLIGDPKENGYRSLHTQVKHASGNFFNVQIRTYTMHRVAQRGITARWWGVPEEQLPQMPQKRREIDKEILVFTPEGELKSLPQGATVLDFAYSIHTDMGDSCTSALVNGEQAEIYRPLKSGDRVEVLAGGPDVHPQLEWLDHVHTSQAMGAIRQWLIQNQRNVMVERGRTFLNQELQAFGLSMADNRVFQLLLQIAAKENESLEDLQAAVGVGRLRASKLVEQLKSMRATALFSSKAKDLVFNVRVLSSEEALLPLKLARCCRPVPFDDIVAYRRGDNTLIVHKRSCPHIKELGKTIPAEWDTDLAEPSYVAIVEALNRPGLANDLTGVISQSGIDMPSFTAYRRIDGVMAEAHIYLGKTTPTQRQRIQKALEIIPHVTQVEVIHSAFITSVQQPSPAASGRSNPYGPGVAKGSRFFGREFECERIISYLCDTSQSNAILLWGQKRIGKTSLVIRLQEQAQGRFLPVYIDMEGLKDASMAQFLYQLMQRISLALKERPAGQEISVPALNKMRKDPLGYFDTFMMLAQEAIDLDPLAIILDEFQCLYSLREESVSRSAIFARLRYQTQHGRGIHFVLSGGGLLSKLLNQSDIVSLFPVTHNERLGALEPKAAHRLIKHGLAHMGNISDSAIDFLLTQTAGHPYYLQLLCSYLYERAQESKTIISAYAATQHIQKWMAEADRSRFQHFWEGYDADSARTNKLILSALAELRGRNDEIEYADLIDKLQAIISEQQLLQTLEDLTNLGILKHDRAAYAIEVKLLARWLRHHWPLHLTLREGGWL